MRMSETIVVYRCTECGKTSVCIGWLHAHIERHGSILRPVADMEYLYTRTERYEIPLDDAQRHRTDPRADTQQRGSADNAANPGGDAVR